jgi:RNA polymerase sigma-70 factor (ECF subfamily)
VAVSFADAFGRGGRGAWLLPTRANGRPAFGHDLRDPGAPLAHGAGLLVLALEGERNAALTRFGGGEVLPRFGMSAALRW